MHPEACHTVRRSVIWQVRDQWGMGGRRGRRAYRFLDHLHRLRGLEHLVGDARRPPPPATVGRLAAASRDHSEPQHLRPCAANLTAPRQRHRHGACLCLCQGPEEIPAAGAENCGSDAKRNQKTASESAPRSGGFGFAVNPLSVSPCCRHGMIAGGFDAWLAQFERKCG